MMIYGNAYVGSGDGGERAYGSVVQGQQGSSWPPPPGAIVSWPYSGSGHVSIYLGDGQWVDNWPDVGHQTHDQVEKGAKAHWLLPPPSFEGTFLNNGIGTSST
jgi:cell wall-associated NlpC family hydrolase